MGTFPQCQSTGWLWAVARHWWLWPAKNISSKKLANPRVILTLLIAGGQEQRPNFAPPMYPQGNNVYQNRGPLFIGQPLNPNPNMPDFHQQRPMPPFGFDFANMYPNNNGQQPLPQQPYPNYPSYNNNQGPAKRFPGGNQAPLPRSIPTFPAFQRPKRRSSRT